MVSSGWFRDASHNAVYIYTGIKIHALTTFNQNIEIV